MAAMWNRRFYLLCLLHLRIRRRLKRREREFWKHPIIAARTLEGAYCTLYGRLREDERKFFNYFRMSTSTFDYILDRLAPHLQRQNTMMRESICPRQMLAVSLRYLASGNTFVDLHYSYRLGEKTIGDCVRRVCNALWDQLVKEQLPFPTEESWQALTQGFKNTAHFPNCIGSVDGKHVRVLKYPRSGSVNLNYKHFFSVVFMAVVDSNYRFVYIDVGAYGKDCDSSVFQRTNFYRMLTDGRLNVPQPALIQEGSDVKLPFVLVGNQAFSLTDKVLRPYKGHFLSDTKKILNNRLSMARRFVECAFGILSNKWRIFQRPLNVTKPLAKSIVKACVVLHNLVREMDGALGWRTEVS